MKMSDFDMKVYENEVIKNEVKMASVEITKLNLKLYLKRFQ